MSSDTVLGQLRMCHYVVKTNVGDVTHEESLRAFPAEGNCLNWVLGHTVATRSGFLAALGGAPVWTKDQAKAYEQHARPLTRADAKPIADIWKAYELSQERLAEALQGLTPAKLAQPLPAELRGAPAKTVGELLAVVGMHDAYHAGQTGTFRRLLGRPPADL